MVAELPPAVAFMLSEFRGSKVLLADVRKKFRDNSFVKDFNDQCLAGIRAFTYADRLEARVDKFDIYAGDSLDPLSASGKCREFECRIAYTHQFARTACLYADRVVIPDPFSFSGIDASDESVFLCLTVLKILKPLLEAGIIAFGPAAFLACKPCGKVTRSAEKKLADGLWHEFRRNDPEVFRFKDGRRWYLSFGSPLLTSMGDEYRIIVPASKKAMAATKPDVIVKGKGALTLVRGYQKDFRSHFARSAHGVVFSSNMGGRCNATVAANSREEAAGYRLLDSRKIGVTSRNWSMLRTVPLPALQRLSALQAMQVREEAEKAMPAFRAKLQRDLMSLKDFSDDAEEKRALDVASDLRLAARELEGQLASVHLPRHSEKLFAGLAIALEIVALSSGSPSAIIAVSGTFAALMLAAHKTERDRMEKHEVLAHQPAYVLLTAERIHAAKH